MKVEIHYAPVPPPPPEYQIILEMTTKELCALKTLLDIKPVISLSLTENDVCQGILRALSQPHR